jgi:hypothetical protein
MNRELIEDLIRKSCDIVHHERESDNHIEVFNKYKFAQNLILECINISYEYDLPKLSGPGLAIGNRIGEHFGIEE